MKTHAIPSPLLLLFGVVACGPAQPCPSCDGGEDLADDDEDLPGPDLPCGGADLQTDKYNCGTCGNVCPLQYEGTSYEAGRCTEGQCGGPYWFASAFNSPTPPRTCAHVCGLGGASCIDGGCSGKSGFVCAELGDFSDLCASPEQNAQSTMTTCDEPAQWDPWFDEGNVYPGIFCCCGEP